MLMTGSVKIFGTMDTVIYIYDGNRLLKQLNIDKFRLK